jgi:hypothetical protein
VTSLTFDDGDLGVISDHSMTSFMISNQLAVFRRDYHRFPVVFFIFYKQKLLETLQQQQNPPHLLLWTHDNGILGNFQFSHRNCGVILLGGVNGCDVDHVLQIGSRETRRATREQIDIDIGAASFTKVQVDDLASVFTETVFRNRNRES